MSTTGLDSSKYLRRRGPTRSAVIRDAVRRYLLKWGIALPVLTGHSTGSVPGSSPSENFFGETSRAATRRETSSSHRPAPSNTSRTNGSG
ncbi:MAG: ribbon-helix-helix protein, CopG family [Nitrospiraceae bacterium]